jgi:rod shape-determining protein MreC
MALSFNRMNKKAAASILLVLFLFVTIGVTAQPRATVSIVEGSIVDAFSVLQRPFQRVGSFFSELFEQMRQLSTLKADNERMRKELEQIRSEYLYLQEREQENQRLKSLLEFREASEYPTLPAKVAGRSATHWYGTIMLDKGARDGVLKDMPVVTGTGLVGRIISTTERSSMVMILLDPDSGAGGYIQRTRDHGVILGRPGGENILDMRLFTRDSEVRAGDVVLTSGLGEIYPKEIPIGVVKEVVRREYGLTTYALVEPYVDFDRLEEVLILKIILD